MQKDELDCYRFITLEKPYKAAAPTKLLTRELFTSHGSLHHAQKYQVQLRIFLNEMCHLIQTHARLQWEGQAMAAAPRNSNWFHRSRFGRTLKKSTITRLFRRRSNLPRATSEERPEVTECLENLEKVLYAIKWRGDSLEHISIDFTSPLSKCNDVIKNVIFHALEEYESKIRSVALFFTGLVILMYRAGL